MATQSQIMYDRVQIFLNGVQYLPNGQIRSYSQAAKYSSTQQMGMTPDGTPAGRIIGGSKIDPISWREYLPTEGEYLNWRTFLIANPNAIITIQPITITTLGEVVAQAPSFTITGLNVTDQTMDAPGESEAVARSCAFNASTSSNM